MKYSKLVFTSCLMTLLFACSSDDENPTSMPDAFEISDEPFSGTVDGEEFTVEAAKGEITFEGLDENLNPIENDGIEKLKFILRDTDFECGINFDTADFNVSATIETGIEGIQTTVDVRTQTAEGIALQSGGLVQLVSINETEAVIRIQTSGDAYSLEGEFTVDICPEPQVSVEQ